MFFYVITEIMPLTCFLDIVGCVPEKMAPKYTNMLPFLKKLFVESSRENIRETAALIYAIILVHTSGKPVIDNFIDEFVGEALSNKSLESQCGYASAFSHICERVIHLSRKGKFSVNKFTVSNWPPYKSGVECLGNINFK